MGRVTLWTKQLAVVATVLVLAAGAAAPDKGHLGERGSYDLDDLFSRDPLHDVLSLRDAGTVTFVITAEGPAAAADVSVTPPLSFSVGARYLTKWRLSEAESGRFRAESRAENRRLHRRGTLPVAIRVPVADLTTYDRVTVRASTAPGAGVCGGSTGEPWYLTGGTCGSPNTGPNRARCTAVYAGRIVDADLGSTMSACEVEWSDLKDVPCGPRPCLTAPAAKDPRSMLARHGRAAMVAGLRDDGSLAPQPSRGPDRVTFTVTGPPGREADVTRPVKGPAVSSRTCFRTVCQEVQPPPQRRRLPYTFSIAAGEITDIAANGSDDYTVRATTILHIPECPRPKDNAVVVGCGVGGAGRNLARCVATFHGRIVDTDLGGTFGICQLDANDLRTR